MGRAMTIVRNDQTALASFVNVEVGGNSQGSEMTILEVAPFPTTVVEYGDFIDSGGYHEREWWSSMSTAVLPSSSGTTLSLA